MRRRGRENSVNVLSYPCDAMFPKRPVQVFVPVIDLNLSVKNKRGKHELLNLVPISNRTGSSILLTSGCWSVTSPPPTSPAAPQSCTLWTQLVAKLNHIFANHVLFRRIDCTESRRFKSKRSSSNVVILQYNVQ